MDQTPNPHHEADQRLDITRDHCPMTYVRVRLALDRMNSGEVLEVSMSGIEPRRNVPHSASEQGHTVLGTVDNPNGDTTLWIRKK
ncbi:MAG: sulfurtransferase TusA family protein [Lysobacteraceae bacterium]|nr:MAG: sulfurtransferase TusA family protein [Xanthomonadaceae bacterium]